MANIKLPDILPYIGNEEDALKYLIGEGALVYDDICEKMDCNGRVKRVGKMIRCPRQDCRWSVSILANTIFSKTRIKIHTLLFMLWLWIAGARHKMLFTLTRVGSPNSVTKWVKKFNHLLAASLLDEDVMVGGEGIIVEIDESKFGKRKYHRGHRVDGVWVLGGVEKTEKRRLFMCSVPDRSKNTLLDVIAMHVKPGSIIHTDLWKAYDGIAEELGFEHRTVNHSQTYVNPVDGTHTNTIEGTWGAVKYQISPRNRNKSDINAKLTKFIWMRKNSDNKWAAVLSAIRDVIYVNGKPLEFY